LGDILGKKAQTSIPVAGCRPIVIYSTVTDSLMVAICNPLSEKVQLTIPRQYLVEFVKAYESHAHNSCIILLFLCFHMVVIYFYSEAVEGVHMRPVEPKFLPTAWPPLVPG